MKIKFFLLFLFSVLNIYAQEISFQEVSHDFGLINESEEVYHDFYFTNTGDKPLRIHTIIVACGCTYSVNEKKEIQPGEESFIRIVYNPKGRNEKDFIQTAEIYTNSLNYGTHKGVHNLIITGKVERGEKTPVYFYTLQPTEKASKKSKVKTKKLNNFEVILSRIREELLKDIKVSRVDSITLSDVSFLCEGGSWGDIDYACYIRTNWEPTTHMRRIYNMAVSYVHPESKYYGNEHLYKAIIDALAFWDKTKPKSHNWWHNQIAVPQTLGNTLVLLADGKEKISPELQEALFKIMASPDPRKWTGANKLDIALYHIQRGVLLQNDSIVKAAASEAFQPIRITLSEGVQPDYSYHQHGNQLYIGGYGIVFVQEEIKVANWLKDTRYGLEKEKLELLTSYTTDTYLNIFRGGIMDFNATGRGISRPGELYGKNRNYKLIQSLQTLDSDNKAKYKELEKIHVKTGGGEYSKIPFNRMFWRSDYMLHKRPEYDFSIRAASNRIRKTESGNGENLYGAFLSDGATAIRVYGDEYFDIFPVWDWSKIPGTTVPKQTTEIAVAWGEMGKSVFTGGVSDGEQGVMAFWMNDYGIEAKKAWFLFDKEIICLGTGIRGDKEITTTLNQCYLRGEIFVDGIKFDTEGNKEEINLKTQNIWHNGVLYVLPYSSEVKLYSGNQTGSWNKINYNYSDREVRKDVFKLWIDHEQNPVNASYAYIIVAGTDANTSYKNENIEIISNQNDIQAVYQKELDIIQVVFYSPQTLKYGDFEIEVDIPCTLMVKNASYEPQLFLADPSQENEKVNLSFKNGKTTLKNTVYLPKEKGMKGSTVIVKR